MASKAKPKPSPPTAAAAAAAATAQSVPLEDLFSTLHQHAQSFEYEQAIKAADQVLAITPGDEDALRCKVVTLIKSDAIDRALVAIQAAEGLPIDLGFNKVYCLYRQNKLHEALKSLDGLEGNAMVLQLESQIFYRLMRMDACVESYEKLQKFKIESLDLKTNIIAALISAGKAVEVQRTMEALKIKPSSSFEVAYNTACSLIEKDKYADAEQLLLTARRLYTGIRTLKPKPRSKIGEISESMTALNVDQTNTTYNGKLPSLSPTHLAASVPMKGHGLSRQLQLGPLQITRKDGWPLQEFKQTRKMDARKKSLKRL